MPRWSRESASAGARCAPVRGAVGRAAVIAVLGLAACTDGASAPTEGGGDRGPTIPVTPDVGDLPSQVVNGVRVFQLRAHVFTQQLAGFPVRTAQVWGYNGSTPGPTAIAYEGERVRFVVKNDLPEPTTVHFHGAHAPNEADGVGGISQPQPIPPGGTYAYEFTPEHPGTFAYHSHTQSATQELKGLDAFFIVLPKREAARDQVDRDYALVLQSWFFKEEGQPVVVFPPGGEFNFHTLNGKTRDVASELPGRVGEKIRIRFYNASQLQHAMHQHGFDMVIESQNGHMLGDRHVVTTVDQGPGNFHEVVFTADKPGKRIFHCHFPHHTTNDMMEGPQGSPVGMTRVFNITE